MEGLIGSALLLGILYAALKATGLVKTADRIFPIPEGQAFDFDTLVARSGSHGVVLCLLEWWKPEGKMLAGFRQRILSEIAGAIGQSACKLYLVNLGALVYRSALTAFLNEKGLGRSGCLILENGNVRGYRHAGSDAELISALKEALEHGQLCSASKGEPEATELGEPKEPWYARDARLLAIADRREVAFREVLAQSGEHLTVVCSIGNTKESLRDFEEQALPVIAALLEERHCRLYVYSDIPSALREYTDRHGVTSGILDLPEGVLLISGGRLLYYKKYRTWLTRKRSGEIERLVHEALEHAG